MKKLLFLIFLFASFETFAADWKIITAIEDGLIFVDASTILQAGKYRKAWILWDYKYSQKTPDQFGVTYKSVKELDYYDCADNQSATIQELLYDGMDGLGENVRSTGGAFHSGAMKDVAPDTVGQTILKFVCSSPIKRH